MHDYIIIGAGSAGSVLAGRLTERGNHTVLLLEAGGPDKRQEIHIPAAFGKLFRSEVDWAYETAPQAALGGRRLYWPRGKMLGGSSSMNAMIYQRGHRQCYDDWAAQGNHGWDYDDVLPFFKRLEHFEPGANAYHGSGGPQNVANLRGPQPLSRAFVAACAEAGLPLNDDHNGATQEGFGLFRVTQKQGKRHSAAAAYLKPALGRPNLEVVTHAHATRLLFDGTRCTGVAYQRDGQALTAHARREVIVCGGTVNSPQLLLVSGIGDGAQLQALGVPVVQHLPGVGQNVQDHLAILVGFQCNAPITLLNAEKPWQIAQYLLFRRGMLTSNVGEAGGFTRILPDAPIPDLQFHFGPTFFVNHGFDNPKAHGFSIGPTLVQPKSRGMITLTSPDPLAAPEIQPCYLTHPDDVQILVEGIKLARRIAEAPALARFREDEFAPGAAFQSDAEIADAVRREVHSLYHPVGSCKMGHDPLAVVDDRLAVHGLTGLRVVDASIMPRIVNANTNVPTMMIAEKAAALILGG